MITKAPFPRRRISIRPGTGRKGVKACGDLFPFDTQRPCGGAGGQGVLDIVPSGGGQADRDLDPVDDEREANPFRPCRFYPASGDIRARFETEGDAIASPAPG